MFLLCRLEFAFYTGINDEGHEDFVPFSSLSRIDNNVSNSLGVLEAIDVPEAVHSNRWGVQISLVL